MKTARTYVFMFVPIPRHRWRDFGTGGSAGILPAVCGMLPDNTDHKGTPRGAGWNPLIMYAAQEIAGNMPALPNHLFWTWFVDNPRRNLQ
jgi:hypothetical protein